MDINPIPVNYRYTNKASEANKWLKELEQESFIACDFEAAVRYTPEQRVLLTQYSTDESLPYLERQRALSTLSATALDHPAHTVLTHCSIATSESKGMVFVLDNSAITKRILGFLTSTEVKQIWHGATYDFKQIYHRTGKMPKNYEDTSVFAKTLFNHVDRGRSRTGLKELAGTAYGAWGLSSDNFVTENMYDPKMLLYAATDACATYFLYERMMEATSEEMEGYPAPSTADITYSPWDQLATAVSPKGAHYPEAYFYHNTAKHLVRDTVRFTMNGLPISLQEVSNLEEEIDGILEEVHKDLAANVYVIRYLESRNKELLSSYRNVQEAKCKPPEHFYKEFDATSAIHRSYYMDVFAKRVNLPHPEETYPSGVAKWSAKLVKKLSAGYPSLQALVDKTLDPKSPTAVAAMEQLAKDKSDMYNANYEALLETPKLKPLVFNPGSANHKRELFAMVGLESEAKSSKTGDDSWSREQIERVNKETEDDDLREFTQLLIDHSFAAIIKNNFIPAFYQYSLNDILHGQYNLLGAKSGRYTSSNPNMLNAPSSGSRFAKGVKKCFIAPEGFVVAAIDYAALEDRVIANLSEDPNKLNIFLKGVDGHSLAAMFYWSDVAKAALEFKVLVDAKNATLVELRSRGKRISFGLAYGAFPKKVAASAKIPMEEAEKIFNAYHEELYPGVTAYREDYVLPTAQKQGYIHLGLGFRLYTENATKDIRSLNNGTCQFWSILTALTINKLHQLIDQNNLQNDILVTATIYDSIYLCVRDDPEIIQWLNKCIVPIMETQFMEGQILGNSADLEIGPSWAKLYKLPHNATIEEIQEIRSQWYGKLCH
jgi:DNA polymerase I-like protein with 3'-5' exonuclease and polymerase domains